MPPSDAIISTRLALDDIYEAGGVTANACAVCTKHSIATTPKAPRRGAALLTHPVAARTLWPGRCCPGAYV